MLACLVLPAPCPAEFSACGARADCPVRADADRPVRADTDRRSSGWGAVSEDVTPLRPILNILRPPHLHADKRHRVAELVRALRTIVVIELGREPSWSEPFASLLSSWGCYRAGPSPSRVLLSAIHFFLPLHSQLVHTHDHSGHGGELPHISPQRHISPSRTVYNARDDASRRGHLKGRKIGAEVPPHRPGTCHDADVSSRGSQHWRGAGSCTSRWSV